MDKTKRILQQIALREGISVAEVRYKINYAIRQAYERSKRENNLYALDLWKQTPCKGEIPTAEEFLPWIAEYTENKAIQHPLS